MNLRSLRPEYAGANRRSRPTERDPSHWPTPFWHPSPSHPQAHFTCANFVVLDREHVQAHRDLRAEAAGHQMEYIRHLVADLRDRTDARFTLLTTAHAARHKNCERLVRDFADSLTATVVPEPSAGHRGFRALGRFLEYQWQSAQMAEAAMRRDRMGTDRLRPAAAPRIHRLAASRLATAGIRGQTLGDDRGWNTLPPPGVRDHRVVALDRPDPGLPFRRLLDDPTLIRFGTVNPYLPRAAGNPRVVYCPDPCRAAGAHRAGPGTR